MAVHKEFELTCDGVPTGPFDCPTPALHAATVTDLRRAARHAGWAHVHRSGGWTDLCPDHAEQQQATHGARGRCGTCGAEVALNMSGAVRGHLLPKRPGVRFRMPCEGSRKPPQEAVSDGD